MFKRGVSSRLPLSAALRRYWPFLLGITAFHFLIVFVPGMTDNRGLVTALFFAAVVPAMIPTLFGSAPYSFWVVACLYWFFGFLLAILVKAAIYTLFAWGVVP